MMGERRRQAFERAARTLCGLLLRPHGDGGTADPAAGRTGADRRGLGGAGRSLRANLIRSPGMSPTTTTRAVHPHRQRGAGADRARRSATGLNERGAPRRRWIGDMATTPRDVHVARIHFRGLPCASSTAQDLRPRKLAACRTGSPFHAAYWRVRHNSVRREAMSSRSTRRRSGPASPLAACAPSACRSVSMPMTCMASTR